MVEAAFAQQHGKTLNFGAFSEAVAQLNDWYKSRGLLGQVRIQVRGGPLCSSTAKLTFGAFSEAMAQLTTGTSHAGETRSSCCRLAAVVVLLH